MKYPLYTQKLKVRTKPMFINLLRQSIHGYVIMDALPQSKSPNGNAAIGVCDSDINRTSKNFDICFVYVGI